MIASLVPSVFASLLDNGPNYNAYIAGPLMLGIGIFGLRHSYKLYKDYRRMRATPQTAATQPKNGLSRIRGLAQAETLVTSPFTHTSCCYYRAEVEQEGGLDFTLDASISSRSQSWHKIHEEISAAGFFLRDASGGVRVQPDGLELDIPTTLLHEVPAKNRNAQDQALVDYVTRNCPDKLKTKFAEIVQDALMSSEQAADSLVQQRLQQWRQRRERLFQRKTKNQYLRFTEYCILPGNEYEIAAAATSDLGNGERVLSKGAGKEMFLLSSQKSPAMEKTHFKKLVNIAGWSAAFAVFGALVLMFGR
jgi:hypothetical protein